MTTVAIVQARLSSSRMPGKVLQALCGASMLEHQLARIKKANLIDQLVVATSVETSDDPIEMLCQKLNIDCFRGSLNDVLDRYYQAAKQYGATSIVRLTADCPLTAPCLIDKVINCFQSNAFDYVSNTIKPTYPDGLDVEVFSFLALEQAWQKAKLPSEREHVTPYIINHPERFSLGSFEDEADLSHLRWTVDYPEDFEFVKKVYQSLYVNNPGFSMQDILALLKNHPELLEINQQFQRNEGMKKSLLADQEANDE